VKEAVTVERLAEDMERELAELFPKQSDLRLQAVRLPIHLEESGPNKQTELAEELGLKGYAMSRLLAKLELHRYTVRRREGTDKLVSLIRTKTLDRSAFGGRNPVDQPRQAPRQWEQWMEK